MTKLMKEHDVDPGGSLTRLATEPYVNSHLVNTNPIFTDTFSSDTRASYTYISGAQSDLAVSGGVLLPASSGATIKEIRPGSVSARRSFVSKVKIRPELVNNGTWLGKFLNANDEIYAGYYNGQVSVYGRTGGGSRSVLAVRNISGSFAAGTDYWLLALFTGSGVSCSMWDADPEGTVTDANRRGGVSAQHSVNLDLQNAYPGLHIENIGDNNAKVDDFKIWAGNAHPFSLDLF